MHFHIYNHKEKISKSNKINGKLKENPLENGKKIPYLLSCLA
jgi:hypothetical protein